MISRGLSASSIKTYIQCPLKYYYTYEKDIRASAEHLSFGSLIHKVLERWFQEDEDIFDIYKQEWESSDLNSIQYYKLGNDLLKNFIEKNNKEEILNLGLEIQFELEIADGIKIRGVMDRVDVLDGETIEVVDYKTSFTTMNSYELEEDVQLSMYDLATSMMFPEYPKRKLTLDYLRYEKVSTARTQQYRDNFVEWLVSMYNRITNDNDPKPNLNQYCNYCECKNDCSAYKQVLEGEVELNIVQVEEFQSVWEEIGKINNKINILDGRKKELQNIIKEEFKNNLRDSIPFDNGSELYKSGEMRHNYRLEDLIQYFPEDWSKFITIRKGEVDKAIGKNRELKKLLELNQDTYYIEPTLRIRKTK